MWDARKGHDMLKNYRQRRAIAQAGRRLRAMYPWRTPGV